MGKYAGRVVARVVVDGEDLAEELIAAGLARAYDGGRRQERGSNRRLDLGGWPGAPS